MKHLKIAGLCFASMLVMGMALAANASASIEHPLLWLLCLKTGTSGVAPTKYESNQCTKTNAALEGEWESAGLPTGGSDTVRLLGYSLALRDNGLGTTALCPDVGVAWGLIETGKLITKVAEAPHPEAEGCKLEGEFLTCRPGKLEEIKGIHLPWTSSEVLETEGKHLATIVGTGGHPGWSVRCAEQTDTCEEVTEKTELIDLGSGVTKNVLLVLAIFQNKVKATCSLGGKEKGEVKGLIAILLWQGNGLSLTTL